MFSRREPAHGSRRDRMDGEERHGAKREPGAPLRDDFAQDRVADADDRAPEHPVRQMVSAEAEARLEPGIEKQRGVAQRLIDHQLVELTQVKQRLKTSKSVQVPQRTEIVALENGIGLDEGPVDPQRDGPNRGQKRPTGAPKARHTKAPPRSSPRRRRRG